MTIWNNETACLYTLIAYVLVFLGGYLVGSFPTAYVFVKLRLGADITRVGSGNVGALNAGVVSGSKWVGIAVGVVDGLKGLVVVLAMSALQSDFWLAASGLLGTVVGHNYPLWLKFKGGRGLATACGGLMAIGLSYTIIWCTLWAILKWQRQSILRSNLIAIVATPVILSVMPSTFIEQLMVSAASPADFRWFSWILSFLLILSHRDAVREFRTAKE